MRLSRSNLFTNCNFTGGPELARGDRFWQPKSVRGDRFWRGDQNFHYKPFPIINVVLNKQTIFQGHKALLTAIKFSLRCHISAGKIDHTKDLLYLKNGLASHTNLVFKCCSEPSS